MAADVEQQAFITSGSQPVGPGTAFNDLTVGRVARYMARTRPEAVALDDGAVRLTYAELDARADRLAAGLLMLGLQRGSVISAYLPNCIDYVVVVLAVARAGGVFSPLNPRFKAHELSAILAQARPFAVFSTGERVEALQSAAKLAGHRTVIVTVDGRGDGITPLAELMPDRPAELPQVVETDFFSLMFTSGTTGVPKGALATHRARMLWVLNAAILYGLRPDDVYLGTMPQVHSAGLTFTLMHLYAGGAVQILQDFDPARYLDLVEKRRVSSSLVVPTMLVMILEELQTGGRSYDLSSLRRLVTCGSPLQPVTKRAVIERITPELWDYYGSTESNSMTVLRPQDQLSKSGSVGKPFVGVDIRIAGENGQALPAGERGEVQCRNPSLMTCYLGRPEETRAALVDGWFRTGDLGWLDDEDYLHLLGRAGDVVISGGINIYPAEIEQVLMRHPMVLDCAVTGEPDAKWGQVVAAHVVPRSGHAIDLAEVQSHCTAFLADYKKPRRLHLRAEIPKNVGGKAIKAALRQAQGEPTQA